jgi:hypothetical protein
MTVDQDVPATGRGPHAHHREEVHVLQQAGALHFANSQPKPWWGDVWMSI